MDNAYAAGPRLDPAMEMAGYPVIDWAIAAEQDTTCPRCGAEFLSLGDLSDHVQSHVLNAPGADHVCIECGAAFDTSAGLEEHAWVHA